MNLPIWRRGEQGQAATRSSNAKQQREATTRSSNAKRHGEARRGKSERSKTRPPDRPTYLVSPDADAVLRDVIRPLPLLLSNSEKPLLVASIRSVRYQLPQEDIPVGVQRVDDDVHHPPHFCLELVPLFPFLDCDFFSGLRHPQGRRVA